MTTTLQTNRARKSPGSADRFEKWIQAPLTHYRSSYIGNEWQLYLAQPAPSTSASQVAANLLPVSLPALFQAIAAEAEDTQLLSGWLALAEDTFSFWDNDLDAAYDDL